MILEKIREIFWRDNLSRVKILGVDKNQLPETIKLNKVVNPLTQEEFWVSNIEDSCIKYSPIVYCTTESRDGRIVLTESYLFSSI